MNKLKSMYITILIAVYSLICVNSCSDISDNQTYRLLEEVESYLEVRPDSALAVLECIEKGILVAPEIRAKYALLMSMALDKNYIDLQSDSIIAPAVKYYEKHGTPDDNLKVFYYRGRISMNVGDYESAMSDFVQAEKYVAESSDDSVVGRLYKALTTICIYCYDSEGIIMYANKAADFYIARQDTTKYILSLNDIVAGHLNKQDTTSAKQCLEIIKPYLPELSIYLKSTYYGNLLLAQISANDSNLTRTLCEYLASVQNEELVKWLPVAKAYYKEEEYIKALEAIEFYNRYDGRRTDAYYWIAGQIYEATGQDIKAKECYKTYIEITDDKLGYLVNADIRFINERHQNELEQIKSTNTRIIIILSSIIILTIATLVIAYIRRLLRERISENQMLETEKVKYEQLYTDAINEKALLTKLLEDTLTPSETRAIIYSRIEILNSIITSRISDRDSDIKKSNKALEDLLSDRDLFISSTRMIINEVNPQFIMTLKSRGLSEDEITLCCLYSIGLKGKDIKDYTRQSRLYIQSAEIRHKLGLVENDTNLSIYLRNMLENGKC